MSGEIIREINMATTNPFQFIQQGKGDYDMLDPDEIAKTYLQFHNQHKSAWAWEIELRPWVETF